MPPRRPGWAVVLDFDGTVSMQDVSDQILLRFGAATPGEIRASYRRGTVTETWMREHFRRLGCARRRVERYVLSAAKLRPGFGAFLRLCRERGVPVEIVSGGVDFYLDRLLSAWKADGLKRYRAASRFGPGGVSLRYAFLRGRTIEEFKRSRVRFHQRRSRRVLFAGDGVGDLAAARAADAAFARGALLRFLREDGLPARPLRDFRPLTRFLEARCSPR
ncbi:MAG TPA: hypothetical protein DD417_10245 [Elusimicrobia bacterium]|nr:hypothetical protein [Elusimicrobiota bacterium]